MSGNVILVGAGPGDPGLLTVKGREALAQAEVVVYDRLISPAILAMIPEGAEAIDVGKRAARHTVPQREINQILLRKAQEGKHVVRLKGGDPFVFGRGGEELEILAENGIDFQVIPGVTSAVAAAAYAGIPVTHRDCCSSLHVVTGHRREGTALDIQFRALVQGGGTLVFLMGVGALPEIVSGLLEAGMAPNTPAAMVERGTTPCQRRCGGTLSNLPERAAEMGISSPAVIVVGQVCAQAEKFDWFSRLPLKGRRILVTRPKERAGALSEKLRALGADVTEYPCIATVPLDPCPELEEALGRLSRYEWLAFTSPAGVEAVWRCLGRLGRDARAFGNIKLAAIGGGTAKALEGHGLSADLVPEVYDARHLGMALAGAAKARVLILRAQEGSPALTEALSGAGVSYDDIAVYRTIYQNPRWAELRRALDAGELAYVTFTSASTVKGFVSTVGADADFGKIVGLCIGEQTAGEAEKHGIPVQVAEKATVDALVALAAKACRER
ncbi:MAG: uroporphyrinogen-III C-methyltransferase [Oscillospiraceae bacterium]|jgi:uroporphyrinogen III methyltransferase/synthase|nr:uroporphyrinogen-III C-methyltransferase [Oscillospiraceae bacterium]